MVSWREPKQLLHVDGRLYLREYDCDDEEEDEEWYKDAADWSDEKKAAGNRIFVLTPEGRALQVWMAPPYFRVIFMARCRRTLIVQGWSDIEKIPKLIALKGI